MRIAYFLTWHDGVGRGVLDKVNEQIGFWKFAGHEVGVFMVVHEDSSAVLSHYSHDVRAQTYRSTLASLIAQIRALKQLKSFTPDIIYLRPSLRNLWLLRFLTSVPLVAEIQTNDLFESKLKSRAKFILTRALRGSLKRANGLVFVSSELACAPEFAFFSSTRVTISNGIDLSRVTPASFRERHGPPSLLFLASTVSPWHGADHLLRLAHRRQDWRFHIIGNVDSPTAPSPNVIFHGFSDAEKIRRIAGDVDVGVGPLALYRNGMHEASPLKVRQFLALGLPVIGGYLDSDVHQDCEYFLRIPNTPEALLDSMEAIQMFLEKWRGRRVKRKDVLSIDSFNKEELRIDFFHRVHLEWKAGQTSGL